jgi:5-(carboxyamino)imidazole ribonucleotide synthase
MSVESTLPSFIAPGATLGVMGGGQLGRMFVHAAQQMGYHTAVLDSDADSPAGLVPVISMSKAWPNSRF